MAYTRKEYTPEERAAYNAQKHEGVLIPDESIIRQDGGEQKSKVIDYKLDIKLDDSEFRPPLF